MQVSTCICLSTSNVIYLTIRWEQNQQNRQICFHGYRNNTNKNKKEEKQQNQFEMTKVVANVGFYLDAKRKTK